MVSRIQMHVLEGYSEVEFIELPGGGPLPRVGDKIAVRDGQYRVSEVLHKYGDDSDITEAYVELYVESVADRDILTTHDPAWLDEKLSRSDI